MIELEGVKYQILEKQNVLVTIKDPILENFLKNRSCQSFERNLSLPISPIITYRVYPFLTLFKCNTSKKRFRDDFSYQGFQSYNGCEAFTLYYNNSSVSSAEFTTLPTTCSMIQLPMASGFESKSNNSDLFDLLAADVSLGWTVSNKCNQCYSSGGQCQVDSNNNFLCSASEGKGTLKTRHLHTILIIIVTEMVGGRKNVDEGLDRTSEIYFPDWLYRRIELDQELQLFGIMNEEEKECARKMVIASLWCIQIAPSNRPSMTKVVEMLEGNLHSLQIPPMPYLFSPSTTEVDSSV
ncbi:hypothetical protein HAX54_026072 [Datura stramonium]|uniref:Wall-associated receptor kinase C-terminal domain-containing protein n=1 Tax=Datura stramonium TaxID=4076 RepID=A0ABS8S6X7_DATST|nr:hypothetical protein [Datura stramonium]